MHQYQNSELIFHGAPISFPGNSFSLLTSFHTTSSLQTMFTGPKHQNLTFSADIPGVRKEELRVEVEDSRYLIIRTEAAEESTEPPARKFKRKFRLPARVDLEAISAGYEDGDLTVTVPRSLRRGFFIDPSDVPDSMEVLARAA